jgi:hypothetical protein
MAEEKTDAGVRTADVVCIVVVARDTGMDGAFCTGVGGTFCTIGPFDVIAALEL